MTELFVNGKKYTIKDDNKKLIRFLRDDLKLLSVKDGCSEGACGTCHVIVNGRATKSCMLPVSFFKNKKIETVEGLTEREKELFVYAFGKCGSVQCGFCIPGMVISGIALLRKNPNPTREEVIFSLRNNICRCTGYKKIVDGILLVGELLRNNIDIHDNFDENYKIGSIISRIDVREKVLGTGKYADDIYLKDMLHASALRSKYPRAKVLSIDSSDAMKLKGIVAVFTAKDIPGNVKSGHLKQDWDCMIMPGNITHFLGDAIALVVGETREIIEKAKLLIKVEYEELKFVKNCAEAKQKDAPLVHKEGNLCAEKHIRRGNPQEAINKSYIVEKCHFETPFTEHAFLEPECCVAIPYKDGVKIYSADQSVYDTRREVASILGIDKEKIIVENPYIGGGFGGKEDVILQHHAALAAYKLKKPVKVKLSRKESILIHPKRHPFSMDFEVGCDKEGNILGVIAKIEADTGAYASLCAPVLERACTHASGPYHYSNFEVYGKSYYTNNPPAGAFRGFGVTQSCFAIESILNKIAKKLNISPWEIRYKNAIRPGEELPNGQIVDESTGIVETLEAVKDEFFKNKNVGIACALKNAGVGVGLPDYGRVEISVKNGKIYIKSGASCIGQGVGTVLSQEVCSVIGCKKKDVVFVSPNTSIVPDSGTTSGSRHTTVTGEASRIALEKFTKKLKDNNWKNLEGQSFFGEYLAKTDPLGSTKNNPISHVAYGYATQICILDDKTGFIDKIIAAHDVGIAINPTGVEGQIEGGVLMGTGYAITEHYSLENCKPSCSYGNIGLLRSTSTPKIESIIVEKKGLKTSFGAIGLGEITSIPTAAAIASAYYNYDGIFRQSLPITNIPYYKHGEFKFN